MSIGFSLNMIQEMALLNFKDMSDRLCANSSEMRDARMNSFQSFFFFFFET